MKRRGEVAVLKFGKKQRQSPKTKVIVNNSGRAAHVGENFLRVYTDGACSGNGKKHAVGGWGVHFPDHEFDDIYGPLKGHPQTNQRAELTAVLEILKLLDSLTFPLTTPCVIYTDSIYTINCMTQWIKTWKKNGWINSQKKPVLNSDLIKEIDKLLSRVSGVNFCHVDGHSNNPFNDQADSLARTGARGQSQLQIVDNRPLE